LIVPVFSICTPKDERNKKRMSQRLPRLEETMKRRQFLKMAAGTTLGATALLTGCGSPATSSTNSNGSAAIEFLTVQAPNSGWELILSTITEQYTKSHPGTTFNPIYVQQVNLPQKLQLLAAQNALPIVYNTPPSADLATQLVKQGEALDIASTFKQLGIFDELIPTAAAIIVKQYDSLLALPFELDMEGFWYNKQIFAQNGLQPPQTFDEMLQIAGKLQQKGIQPFAASGIEGWPITRLIGNYIYRTLGPDAMESVKKGQTKLTDPGYVAAAQAVATIGKLGYFGKGVATLDYQSAEDLLLQGKAAMFYMGSWAVRDFTNASITKIGEENIGYFPFPNVAGGAGNSTQIAMSAGLPSSINARKYNKAIGGWLTYMAKNYGDVSLQKEGVVSGFKVHNPPANLSPLTKFIMDTTSTVSQPVLWFEAYFPTKATNLCNQDAAPLVTGAMSASDFMTAIQGGLS
jgi:raffinose/stachyose/melibiose transport system substrate-binding protein